MNMPNLASRHHAMRASRWALVSTRSVWARTGSAAVNVNNNNKQASLFVFIRVSFVFLDLPAILLFVRPRRNLEMQINGAVIRFARQRGAGPKAVVLALRAEE